MSITPLYSDSKNSLFYTLAEFSSVSMETDSGDDGPESEEEDSDPYPLEGKFVDEADRHR